MQRQSWHKKEKYQHHPQLDEEQQNQSAEFFLIDFEEVRRPRGSRVPEQSHRGEIEQREYEADDKCAEEKVAKENDFLAFHAGAITATARGDCSRHGCHYSFDISTFVIPSSFVIRHSPAAP